MSVAGPLPFPTIAGVWERRRRVGWGIGRNINKNNKKTPLIHGIVKLR
jgi:hypothetical protein